MKRVKIDRSKCAGHGRCYTVAPSVFEPDDEGFPVLVLTDLAEDSEHFTSLTEAVDNCPERALSLVDLSLADKGGS